MDKHENIYTPEEAYNLAASLVKAKDKRVGAIFELISIAEDDNSLTLACQIMRAYLYRKLRYRAAADEAVEYLQFAFLDKNYPLRKNQKLEKERLSYLPKKILNEVTKGKVIKYDTLVLKLGGRILRDAISVDNLDDDFINQELQHFFTRKEIFDMCEAEEKRMQENDPEEIMYNQNLLQLARAAYEDENFEESIEICSRIILNPSDPGVKKERDKLIINCLFEQGKHEEIVNFYNSSLDIKNDNEFLNMSAYLQSLFFTAKTEADYKKVTKKIANHEDFPDFVSLYIRESKTSLLIPYLEKLLNSEDFSLGIALSLVRRLLEEGDFENAYAIAVTSNQRFPKDFITHSMGRLVYKARNGEEWRVEVEGEPDETRLGPLFLAEMMGTYHGYLREIKDKINKYKREETKYESHTLEFYVDGIKRKIDFNQLFSGIKEAYKVGALRAEAYEICSLLLMYFGDIPDIDICITTFMLTEEDIPCETRRAFMAFEFCRYRYPKDYIFNYNGMHIHMQRRMDVPKKIAGTQYEIAYHYAVIDIAESYDKSSDFYDSSMLAVTETINERFNPREEKLLTTEELKNLGKALLSVALEDEENSIITDDYNKIAAVRKMAKKYFTDARDFAFDEHEESKFQSEINEFVLSKVKDFDAMYEERNKIENFTPKLASIRFNLSNKKD